MTKSDSTCSFSGCAAPVRSIGLCNGHYFQQYLGKPLTPLRAWNPSDLDWPTPRTDGRCAVGECDRPPHARGLCRSHYTQIRNGRPVGPVRQHNRVVDGRKVCGMCGEMKPVTQYGKKLDRFAWQCLECRRIDSRMRTYGLTRDEVLALCDISQCEACGRGIDSGTRDHVVDHCHNTGAVRGVLCNGCNSALGHAKDSPETLRALADYIERTRSALVA